MNIFYLLMWANAINQWTTNRSLDKNTDLLEQIREEIRLQGMTPAQRAAERARRIADHAAAVKDFEINAIIATVFVLVIGIAFFFYLANVRLF
jgi:hypothetical protein